MKIVILGAGNGGCAVAADLSLRGHEVTLIKTSQSLHDDNFKYLQKHQGSIALYENNCVKETKIQEVTRDLSKISHAEVVIIYIQTNYHEDLIKRIKEFLQPNQIVLINPGYLSTAYMLKWGLEEVIVVEAQSSFIDCRIFAPGKIKVGFRNARNPLGIYPSNKKGIAQEKLDQLGFPFVYLDNVIEAALHNPNLIVHTVGAIMSLPRIEKTKGEYCMYHEVFTPSVWNILESLDKEKMDILQKLGFARIPYVEACKYRNSLDDSLDAKEVFFWYASMPTRAKGPVKPDSRYITEDVPQGLVMLETLGKELKVLTPITTSLIEIASVALKMNMRENGRTISRLGKKNIMAILKDCTNGIKW